MEIVKTNIANALTSVASNHVVAVANDIFDESLQLYQSDINALINQSQLAYQTLDYITATGSQYIDTGIELEDSSLLKVEAEYSSPSGAGQFMGVAATGEATWGVSFDSPEEQVFTFWKGMGVADRLVFPISATGRHSMTIAGSFVNVGGAAGKVERSKVDAISITGGTIHLFGWNRLGNGGSTPVPGMRLYSAKFWYDGTLLRDFVPSMRTADFAIGLYDRANGVFYPSIGATGFNGGFDGSQLGDLSNYYTKEEVQSLMSRGLLEITEEEFNQIFN